MAIVPSDNSSATMHDNHSAQNPKPALYARLFSNVTRSQIDHELSLIGTYAGSGTGADPFVVKFTAQDPFDPMNLSPAHRWLVSALLSIAALIVTFSSSAYNGGILDLIKRFHASHEVAIAGVSLYVLGFAVGPLLWAPLSEMHGRRIIFIISFVCMTVFTVGAACAQSMAALLVLRFLAGATGASIMTSGPGVMADIFDASKRGLATGVFAMAPFLGPALGKIFAFTSSIVTRLTQPRSNDRRYSWPKGGVAMARRSYGHSVRRHHHLNYPLHSRDVCAGASSTAR